MMLIVDLENKHIVGKAKVKDIKKYGLIRASGIYLNEVENQDRK